MLVPADPAQSGHMARMLKAMAKDDSKEPKILEINPKHPLTHALAQLAASEHAEGGGRQDHGRSSSFMASTFSVSAAKPATRA